MPPLRLWGSILICAFGAFCLVLAACQAATEPTRTPEPTETKVMPLKVYAPVGTPLFRAEAKYTSPVVLTRTAQQVLDIVANSPALLGSKHLAAGMKCESCHDPYPPQAAPSRETCLGCHQQDYAEIAAIPSKRNPHQNHLGAIPCADCHRAHEPYYSTCLECHLEPCDCSLR